MLPDLEKDYETLPVISALWEQFTEALARARHVLVLGHSLHDEALIGKLRDNVQPLQRLAVTVFDPPGTVGPASDAESVRERVRQRLPGAHVIPMRFGGDGELPAVAITRWLESADSSD